MPKSSKWSLKSRIAVECLSNRFNRFYRATVLSCGAEPDEQGGGREDHCVDSYAVSCSPRRMHPPKHFILRYGRYLFCLVLALWSMGCAARYSTENLRSLAPAAEIIDVCVRIPTVESDMVVAAHNSQTGDSVSDRDWEAFERAAETADVIYRYDPNAPNESASRLPWLYHKMSCRTVSSSEKVPLLPGMKEISLSEGMREALVSALLVDEPVRASPTASVAAPDKRFLGQVTFSGIGPRVAYSSEAIDEVGQMLRDTLRTGLPKVPNGAGGQISILDTKAGQVVGGLGAGALIGTTPGGALIAAKLDANPDLQQPTRLFRLGQAGGEMVSGTLQMFIGTGGTIGGAGLSVTGGGAILGVPTCVAGAAIAANGAMTFIHGAHTLVVTICHWDELPSANAAQALDAPGPAAAPAGPPAPAPAPAGPPPVAAAPPPTLTAPTAPLKTTTKTIHKGPNGEIVKTVTKTGDNVTTTLPKKASAPAGTDVKPKVSEAPKISAPKKEPRLPRQGTAERRAIETARQKGINAKQREELANIRAGGKGSGVWTEAELAEIRAGGPFPKDAVWHHDPTVANRPDLAADPSVVRPVRGGVIGHLEAHGGDFRKPYENK